MKLYKEFYRKNNTSSYMRLNKWIRDNSSKYDYKVAGYRGLAWDCSLILIAYWPKKVEHKSFIQKLKNLF